MNPIIRSFSLQKAGNTWEECEDKSDFKHFVKKENLYYPRNDQILMPFSLADGATEGMFSGVWAEILVKSFCRSIKSFNQASDLSLIVKRSSTGWNKWLEDYLRKREKSKKPIQWYEEPGLTAGGFSTLLGFIIANTQNQTSGPWKAVVVGDTCLFQIRNGKLIESFPIKNSLDFNNQPSLISSNQQRSRQISEMQENISGKWLIDDMFLLMTDALACWFLKEHEAENSPFISLCKNSNTEKSFCCWIDYLRQSNSIRNDDVTVIKLDLKN